MPANPDYFTVVCDGIGAIGVDYVDPNTDPDEHPVSAFVWFKPRLPKGYVIWAPGLTPPRGIMLDDIRARFAPEDGRLRTIVAKVLNEKQRIVVTGDPFTLNFDGQPTANIAQGATPQQVTAALEALSNINPGDVFTSGTTTGPGVTVDPYTVTFQGQYTHADVPLMTATNATVTATQEGTSELGVKLVADQPLILTLDDPLIYDVEFELPASDNDGLDKDRKVLPFAFAAATAGQTIDLASVERLPHRSTLA